MAHHNNNNDPYSRLDFNGAGSFDPPSPISSPSHMDPFNSHNNNNRTPSPGRPLQSRVTFQSPSPVYGDQQQHQPLHQPQNPYDAYGGAPQRHNTPGLGPAHANYYDDEMAVQPTYSVQNLAHSYHQQGQQQPGQQLSGQTPGQQYQNPSYNSHEDFDDVYQPSPLEDSYPMHQYNEPGYDKDYDDSQPILSPSQAGFPEGQQDPGYFPPQSTTPVPTIKRWKTVKKVELYQGNLVLDCPVPKKLLSQMPRQNAREFTHMRYTAATCDPADFLKERFTLRQQLFSKPRYTELFIVVTMYNEDEILFARTMRGVIKNIQYMCGRTGSQTWGDEGWKKIVVCIVSDGRLKINPRTKSTLAAMGCYQDGIAKNQVGDKPVTAHIYEYTTQVNLEIKGDLVEVQPGGKNSVPMQVIFCLKEKNQKKINSHRWFFQAFGEVLDPSICVLIDAGTKPGGKSIYHLWRAFELNPECGGACGEIKAMLGAGWKHLRNPLVATQNFEYKMSNILDKPLESAFGFISVLPGAFSAYRFAALQSRKGLPGSMQNDVPEGPLEKYFKGETMHGANSTFFDANMYLAEDRILCFELVTKRNCNWVLTYVKSSYAETDVPDRMPELILQRRRWLNGSFFAAVYALVHAFDIWRSKHSLLRKLMFHIEFLYQFIFMLFSWFALSNFFLVFKILTASLGEASVRFAPGKVLSVVFEWLYLGILLTCFILSLGNRPQGSNKLYMTMVVFWAIIMVYLLFAAIFVSVRAVQSVLENTEGPVTINALFQNRIFRDLLISLCSTYVIYFVSSFLFWEPWHMFTSFLQYLLLSPSYVNVLNVYAFCNTHDISWGTKGDDKVATDLGVVKVQEGGKVDVNIPSDDGDLDAEYTKQVNILREKFVEPPKIRKPEEVQEDYYKGVRSSVVLLWMFTNFGLAAVVLNSAGLDRLQVGPGADERAAIYLSVILWSVAALSLFRFFGSCWFLIIRMFRGV
ncbi:Chitin synthase, class 1 [Orbilia oligospora]|uniref:Chitin synthase n=2 Tax=Orbilia oligospora TaxID=2813651 RepID=A0A7C8N311_ORBOL|nr:Chitin synthase, class 1 [Orbilia oligospora]KAF3094465.1 Chitin synthase, class 1 [Orbilia oligospora]KAF3139987.1 Chitin synthase, class 1 [Orbilia oligospora]